MNKLSYRYMIDIYIFFFLSTYEYICRTIFYILLAPCDLSNPSWEAHYYSNFSITWRNETSAQLAII